MNVINRSVVWYLFYSSVCRSSSYSLLNVEQEVCPVVYHILWGFSPLCSLCNTQNKKVITAWKTLSCVAEMNNAAAAMWIYCFVFIITSSKCCCEANRFKSFLLYVVLLPWFCLSLKSFWFDKATNRKNIQI